MPDQPLYPQAYPGSGKFALLCEGDSSGYEAAILGLWLREREPSTEHVDIRPCGTSEGLRSIADAIGRSVRVIVVEDRDFRSNDTALAECNRKFNEIEQRGVAVRGWLAWSRNEIENFFLDDEVLLPAMRTAFDCTAQEVAEARARAINSLRVFQAVKVAVCSTDIAWERLIKARWVGGGYPKWGASGLTTPTAEDVRANLESGIQALQRMAHSNASFKEPLLGKTLIETFDARIKQWSYDPVPVQTWKSEWAGKEVLKLVRQDLASRFDPPIASKGNRVDKIDWSKVESAAPATGSEAKKSARDAHQAREALDRDIERALQPELVKSLWAYLEQSKEADMNCDFARISNCFEL